MFFLKRDRGFARYKCFFKFIYFVILLLQTDKVH